MTENGPKSLWERMSGKMPSFPTLLLTVMGLLIIVLIIIALLLDSPVLRRLSDPAFARGLITFVITIATIGLAFVLVLESFCGEDTTDKPFQHGREVFAGLMGVLGTIVGFYFGSTEKLIVPLEIAEIRLIDANTDQPQLLAHISGGFPPYKYLITFDRTDQKLPEIQGISQDGWILERLTQTVKPGTKITVAITDKDKKEQKAEKEVTDEGGPPKPKQPSLTQTPKR